MMFWTGFKEVLQGTGSFLVSCNHDYLTAGFNGIAGGGLSGFLLIGLLLQGCIIFYLWRHARQQKLASRSLQDSEIKFKATSTAISDALVAIDDRGLIALFNPAAERMFGYSREQMLGQSLDRILPECYRERHRQALDNYFRNGSSGRLFGSTLELPALCADGHEITVELSLSLLTQGDSATVLAAIRDISQRKDNEEALRLSEERFREMADLMPQSIFETDLEGRVVFANRRTREVAGWSDEGMKRQPSLLEIVAEADKPRALNDIQNVLQGAELHNEEYLLQASDGSAITVIVAATPIVRNATIVGLRGAAFDVTEREAAEQIARENSDKFKRLYQEYQALLDHIPDAITLFTPERIVVRSNLGAAKLLGAPVTELPGKPCSALWKGCSAYDDHCPVKRCFRSGRVEQAFTRTNDGRAWHVRAFPVCDREDKVIYVIALASDVTRQRQLEQEASRAKHLASLGELAAGVAHEINNPINGIINYAQILADDEQIGEESRGVLQGITEEGERIANIVYNLLSFARDRQESKEPVSLAEVLKASLTLTESQLRKDHIRLQTEIDEELPEVLAHFQQLQQVMLNIISNARYALNKRYPESAEGKSLRIYSESSQEPQGDVVRLVFRDQGAGIPAHLLSKIMDPFFTTKPSGAGTGLGLSISHGIIEDHGGRIFIESIEGDHTQVTLELPIAAESEL